MINRLIQNKQYLFIAGTIILFSVCYQLAFKNTIELWQENTQLKSQIAQTNDLSYQPGYLERKNDNLDKLLSTYKADTNEFRSNTINTISLLAEQENVKLSEVPQQNAFYHTDKYIIQKLRFEGEYFSLTRFLNILEGKSGYGIIRSLNYKAASKTPGNESDKKLSLDVFLEMIK